MKHLKKIRMIASKATKVIPKIATNASANSQLQKNLTIILDVQRMSNPTTIASFGALHSSNRVARSKKLLKRTQRKYSLEKWAL